MMGKGRWCLDIGWGDDIWMVGRGSPGKMVGGEMDGSWGDGVCMSGGERYMDDLICEL